MKSIVAIAILCLVGVVIADRHSIKESGIYEKPLPTADEIFPDYRKGKKYILKSPKFDKYPSNRHLRNVFPTEHWVVSGTKMESPHFSIDCKDVSASDYKVRRVRFGWRVKFPQSSPINLGSDWYMTLAIFTDGDTVGRGMLIDHIDENTSEQFRATSTFHVSYGHDLIQYISGGNSIIAKGRGAQQPEWTTLGEEIGPSKEIASRFLENCNYPSLDEPADNNIGPASDADVVYAEEMNRKHPNPHANRGAGIELGWASFGAYGISNHFGKVSSDNSYIIHCNDKKRSIETITATRNDIKGKYWSSHEDLRMALWSDGAPEGIAFNAKFISRPGGAYTQDARLSVSFRMAIDDLTDWITKLSTGDEITLTYQHNGKWHLFHKMSAIPKDVANKFLASCGQPTI